jgi:hypothetical protein
MENKTKCLLDITYLAELILSEAKDLIKGG